MACHAIHSWTFCGLIGAFLDLGLAYLLLCGSTLAFFASKFLGVFGLYLPCPCNGLFGDPNGGKCLQRLLVDYPSRRISSVQMSVKSRLPFDSIWMKDEGCHLNVKLLRDSEHCDGPLEIEGEASCSSFSDARRRSQNLVARDPLQKSEMGAFRFMNSAVVRDGRSDVKGKGVLNQKPRFGLRRRRRAIVGHGKFSSVSSFDPPRFVGRDVSHSPYSVSELGQEISEESSVPINSAGAGLQDDREDPTCIGLDEEYLHGFELNGSFDEGKVMEKDAASIKELVRNVRDELGFDGNEENAIKVLEQALEEGHTARAVLYLELEKERSAAATAADEAMAMILRLQEEKAAIEMEARQYQRMIEEKSAYDEEEMNILKEILVRREREKHVLEKEVETYRHMMLLGKEQLEGDADMAEISGQRSTFSFDMSEDPELMLQRISESIGKRKILKNGRTSSHYEAHTVEKSSCMQAFVKELPSPDWNEDANFLKRGDLQRKVNIDRHHPSVPESFDDCNEEFQVKGMVSIDVDPSASLGGGQKLEGDSELYKLNSLQGHGLLEKTINTIDEEQGGKDNARICHKMVVKDGQNHSGTEINFPCDGEDLEKHEKDTYHGCSHGDISLSETEPSLYDVHVIDDRSKLCKEETCKKSELQLMDAASDRSRKCGLPFDPSGVSRIDVLSDCPSTSRAETDPDIRRCSSDMTTGLPPMSNSLCKALPFDLRRNSMSAVDNERLKLDTEVGWLRERLRIVQEGREKLSFSVEHKEREKIQLQLLEAIASQLREIRQLTEPGKAVRQASLPPTSSKVPSKKRRCRSASLRLHESI